MSGERKTTRYRCPLYASNNIDECEYIGQSRSDLIEHFTEDHYIGNPSFVEEVVDSFLDVMIYTKARWGKWVSISMVKSLVKILRLFKQHYKDSYAHPVEWKTMLIV